MKTSESITNLSKALLVFDAEIGKVGKTSTNPFFKNKYAALPDILDAIKEPLQKAGLTVKQFPEGIDSLVTIIIHGNSGEYIQSEYTMKAVKDDPQQQGSRITYQRRYAIGAALGLNIDEDDDGNKASTTTQDNKKPVVANGKPELKSGTPEFEGAKKWVKEGNGLDAIKKKYNVSSEVEKLLNS